MALKIKIGQSAYDALSDAVKKEYKKNGDDYQLDVEGYEDAAEIKRARDAANTERNEAKRERDEAKARAEAAEAKAATLEAKNVDIANAIKETETKVTATLTKKHETELADRDGKLAKATGSIVNSKRDAQAMAIAERISTAPKLLAPIIAQRLQVDLSDDYVADLKILSADGKATASTIDDLAKEFQTNKEFASVMKASNGSGGGGAPRAPSGGGAPRPGSPPPSPGRAADDLTKMSGKDLAAIIRADREASGLT